VAIWDVGARHADKIREAERVTLPATAKAGV
jgi:hypothetical protein